MMHRYWVNKFDANGESRGSYGFNNFDAALEFLIESKKVLVKGEFARLVDTADEKPEVLRQVEK
jgi:hypothetical protein